jgi:predicted metal-binding membrane protein
MNSTTVANGHKTSSESWLSTAVVLLVTLGTAVVCWLICIDQMRGMNMGVSTRLGPFASFAALWILMMAAMMLPGAIPAVLRYTRASGSILAAPLFSAAYLAIWAIVGIVVYASYRPHGTVVAGVVVITAGVYELTPLKQGLRQQCREALRNGLVFGFDCVGSSIGLMAILVVLGVMSIAWMAIISAIVVAQKILLIRACIDIPFALAIIGLGIAILATPSSVPGLIPTTSHMSVM